MLATVQGHTKGTACDLVCPAYLYLTSTTFCLYTKVIQVLALHGATFSGFCLPLLFSNKTPSYVLHASYGPLFPRQR